VTRSATRRIDGSAARGRLWVREPPGVGVSRCRHAAACRRSCGSEAEIFHLQLIQSEQTLNAYCRLIMFCVQGRELNPRPALLLLPPKGAHRCRWQVQLRQMTLHCDQRLRCQGAGVMSRQLRRTDMVGLLVLRRHRVPTHLHELRCR
jgi:hypothetical protein